MMMLSFLRGLQDTMKIMATVFPPSFIRETTAKLSIIISHIVIL